MFPAKPEETKVCVPYLLLDNGSRIYLTEINLVRKGERGILNSVFSDSANQELEILSGSEAELRYLRDTLIADAEEGQALERQSNHHGELDEHLVEEMVVGEPVEELIEAPEAVVDMPQDSPKPSQSELPLEYQNAPPTYEINEAEIQDSIETKIKRRANESG
jgi:hypothetical protein